MESEYGVQVQDIQDPVSGEVIAKLLQAIGPDGMPLMPDSLEFEARVGCNHCGWKSHPRFGCPYLGSSCPDTTGRIVSDTTCLGGVCGRAIKQSLP